MYYKKEHPAVTVVGIFATIFFTMALTATLIILPIHLSLKGLTSVESYIKDSEFTSELTDVINDEIRDEIKKGNSDLNIDEDFISEEFVEDFMNQVFGVAFNGKEIDADELTNALRDDLEDYLKASDIEYEDYKDDLDKACEDFNKGLKDLSNELKSDSDVATLSDAIETLINTFKVLTIVSGVIAIALALLIILIYKKKFRAMRNLGISGTVAGSLGFAVSAFISVFIASFVTALKAEFASSNATVSFDSIVDKLTGKLGNLSLSLMGASGACLITGIILIILSCIIGSNYKKSCMQSTSSYSSDTTYKGPEF